MRLYKGLIGRTLAKSPWDVNPDIDTWLVTLTTPAGYPVREIHHAWVKFRLAAKRRGVKFEYFAIREWNKKQTCVHVHVVFVGIRRIDFKILREAWSKSLGKDFAWIHCDKLYGESQGVARYVTKYLVKGMEGMEMSVEEIEFGTDSYHKLGGRIFWYSQGYIYPGFADLSKRMYQCGRSQEDGEVVRFRGIGKATLKIAQMMELIKWYTFMQSKGFYPDIGVEKMEKVIQKYALRGWKSVNRFIK